jgi:hypothetical protein
VKKKYRRVLYRLLPSRLLVPWLLLWGGSRATLLRAAGFGRSIRLMRPVDAQNHPLPLMPYTIIRLLQERLDKSMDILEFGAGFSTLFFMSRVGTVTSIEHHAGWIAQLQPQLEANVTLVPTSLDSADLYTAFLTNNQKRFDFILVDGRHRVESFRRALPHLNESGVIVLDDSDRERYAEVHAIAGRAGFRSLEIFGHKPTSLDLHCTTLFYREGNCLRI